MRRALMVVLVVALGALIFAPAALAQDDNPTGDDLGGDDRGGERGGFDDNPSGDDLREDDRGGVGGFDDNLTGDDVVASPTATATPTATVMSSAAASPHAEGSALPRTGGVPLLSAAAGVLLIGSGIMVAMLMRRTS